MFTYSTFRQEPAQAKFRCEVPVSKDYKVYVNSEEVPVYTCRISAFPFNTPWPGHQRWLDQTEVVSFVNLISDEELKIEVEPLTQKACDRFMVKPYSKGVKIERGERITFSLTENGGYVLEPDDYRSLLYIFNNKPVACEDPSAVTHYFGKGIHFPGKIELKSDESIYVDKDALVYGCVFAENAENIRVYGNGIFDDSNEERIFEHCYAPFANGNIKFYDCSNIRIEGIGFVNSAIWCVNLFHCFDVEIDGINVFGQWRYNTDGVDIVNSQRIALRNSFVHSFDDTVTVKGIEQYADTANTDILVENCVLWCDWGRVCEIGLETMCPEYRNIIFKNCDVLRGGSVVCDIQNGDWAEVHDVLFEEIRVELEAFYTKSVLQRSDEQRYDGENTLEIADIVCLINPRFRGMTFHAQGSGEVLKNGDKKYASICDVTVKNIDVYADQRVLDRSGKSCVRVRIVNGIETTEYERITVESVRLNGAAVGKDEMSVVIEGCDESVVTFG